MFDANRCKFKDCTSSVWAASDYCRIHHPDPTAHERTLIKELESRTGLWEYRDYSGFDFGGIDLTNREFRYCRFSGAKFTEAKTDGIHFLLCLLDDIEARDCSFKGSRMMSVMAAGAILTSADFSGSDLINVNFNGIGGRGSIFDESDLFYSRFIGAGLADSSFQDCNLKRVDFSGAYMQGVDFTDSNPEESYLIGGDAE